MVTIKEEFKDRLEQALELRDMKPVELSKMTGIAPATISQYRSGYSRPKDQRLVKIANVLHVDPAWLMGIDVPMENETVDEIDLTKLSEEQYARLRSYYNFLLSEEQ